MTLSPLELSERHLAQVADLYREVTGLPHAHGPLDASAENIDVLKGLYAKAQLARMGPHVARVHRRSHAQRIEEEMKWQAMIESASDRLFAQLDIDGAYTAAVRGWITPPDEPVGGVVAGKITFMDKLRKATGKPKPGDEEEMARWGGMRSGAAAKALRDAQTEGADVRVLRGPDGKVVAVASVKTEGGYTEVVTLASQPGYGGQMMQELARQAARDGKGIKLFSVPEAKGFYEKIGMQRGLREGLFAWSKEQAKVFAKTGGYLAPAGEATPGLTEAENLIAQQMILSIFQGSPAGERMPQAVERALASRLNAEAFQTGAVSQYFGLAAGTSERAGQISLEHMGLNKTFAWAHPENMARDMFQVRGSKVIQNMYGNHMNKLSKIIVDATNPRSPATIQQVTSRIREEWPRLRMWQAERIARTETAAVWTATSAAAYEANGIEEWESLVATGPSIEADVSGACDFCVEMASESHGIMDDPPPWHPNCRCEMVPVLDHEGLDGESIPWLPPDDPWTGGRENGKREFEPRQAKDVPSQPLASMPMPAGPAADTLRADIAAAEGRAAALESPHATLTATGQLDEAKLLKYQIDGERAMIERWRAQLGERPVVPPSDIPGGFVLGQRVRFTYFGKPLEGEVVGIGRNNAEKVLIRYENAAGNKVHAEALPEDIEHPTEAPPPLAPVPPEPTVAPSGRLDITKYTPETVAKETTGNLWRALSRNGRAENQAQQDIAYAQDKIIARELWARWERDPDAGLPEGTLRYSDLAGEQHLHSIYSDGHNTIKEMAESSRAHGKTQMVVSDHSHLVDDAATVREHAEIDALNKEYAAAGIDFRVIKGIEVNILEDGSLDLTAEQLARYEVVNAGMHVARTTNATERYLKVLDQDGITTIAHPHTGGDVVDWDAIAKRAAERNVALEVNGRDILRMQTDEAARKMIVAAQKYKVKIQIASDAHNDTGVIDGLYAARFAAKNGVKADDIIAGQRVVDDVSVPGGAPISPETLSTIKKWRLDTVDEMPAGEKARAVLGDARDTRALHTDSAGRYDAEAQRAHDDAMRQFIGTHAAQERPVALVTAGGPAAGKSVALRANPEMIPEESVIVNADEVMPLLHDFKALDGDPGMAAALHEEASDVASELLHVAIERRTNIVLDGVGNAGPGKFIGKLRELKEAGYEIRVVASDTEINTAIERAVERATKPGSPDLGRFLPVRTQKGLYRDFSARLDEWVKSDVVDEWKIMRTTGAWGDTNTVVVAQGGKGEMEVLHKEMWDDLRSKAHIDAGDGAPPVHTPEVFPTPQWIEPETWNEETFEGILRGQVGNRVRITSTSYSGGEARVTEGVLTQSENYLTIENRTLGNGHGTEHIEVQGSDGEWHTLAVMPEDIRPKPGPPTPPPAPPQDMWKPTLSGETVKPSSRYASIQNTRRPLYNTARQEAMDNLDRHMQIPTEAQPVDIAVGKGQSSNFQPAGRARTGKVEGAKIRVSSVRGEELREDVLDSMYHEWGHYLDWILTKDSMAGTRYGSEVREEFKPLLKALSDSPEIQEWRGFMRNPGSIPDGVWAPRSHINYMTSNIEMFARAYAQYMATITKDEEYLKFVADHVGHRRIDAYNTEGGGWYWTPEHFAPIKQEMDDLFDQLGLRAEQKAEPAPPPHEAPPKPEPTEAPKPPEPEPVEDRGEGGLKGTPVPPGTFLQTREGFERVLASYEGRTIRVKYGIGKGQQEVGIVKYQHGKWWVGGSNFYRHDVMRSIEVKVGGRFKDMADFEKMTPAERDRTIQPGTVRTATGEKVSAESEEPVGGWQFPDAPPSGVIGDYPETPVFKSVTEAKAFAQKFIARDVEFTQSKIDLPGIQDALDGLASVLRPFGVKLERLQVEKPKGVKALAYYIEGAGSRPITVGGEKTYWRGEMIQAQVRSFNRAAMTKEAGVETTEKFEFVKATNLAQWRRWIEREETEKRPGWDTRKAQYERQIEAYEACPRYWIASADPAQAGKAIMAHEAGHALSYNMGDALDYGSDGLANIFNSRLELHGVTETDKMRVSKYGATGDNARQQEGSELWAECTAARAIGQWDLIPKNIQDAYQDVLDSIKPEHIQAHMAKTAERDSFHAASDEEKAQRIADQIAREARAKDTAAEPSPGADVVADLESRPVGTRFSVPKTDSTRAIWGVWEKEDIAGMTFWRAVTGRQEGEHQASSYFTNYSEHVGRALEGAITVKARWEGVQKWAGVR